MQIATNISNPHPTTPQEKKAWKAACDFEAIFVRQLLKEMATAKDPLMGEDSEVAQDIYQDMYHTQLADAISKNSGLGMARMLYPQILRQGDADLPQMQQPGRVPDRVLRAYAAKGARGAANPPDSLPDADDPREAYLRSLTSKASQATGVSESLLRSVIQVESGGNASAVSPKGAQGLMQLMPDTARAVGVTRPHDPEQSVMGGARYLAQMLQRYDGDETKALAAYNAGPGNVDKFGGVPPFAETQGYVRKVKAWRSRLLQETSL
jgi:soluble lytic murein transglycosylase-like protein